MDREKRKEKKRKEKKREKKKYKCVSCQAKWTDSRWVLPNGLENTSVVGRIKYCTYFPHNTGK